MDFHCIGSALRCLDNSSALVFSHLAISLTEKVPPVWWGPAAVGGYWLAKIQVFRRENKCPFLSF